MAQDNDLPDFSDEQLLPSGFSETFTKGKEQTSKTEEKPEGSEEIDGLRKDIQELTSGINRMLKIFEKAHEDIISEPSQSVDAKLDKIVEQNTILIKAIYEMLEISKNNLPRIVKQTRLSKPLRKASRKIHI